MLGNTAIDRSKRFANPTSLTSLLVGMILLYQVANYAFLKSALDDLNSDFNSELEASCAADPGLASGSSLCIEAQLFRGWHEMPGDAPESLEKLLEIAPPRLQPSTSLVPMPPKSASEAAAGATVPASAPNAEHDAARQDQSQTANFSHNLVDLQQRLEAKNQEQANRHAQHQALRALSVAARGIAEDTPAKDAPATEDRMTPWAHKVDDLTHDIQHHMEARRKEREEHLAARAAMHEARLARLQEAAAAQAAAPISPTELYKQREHHSFMEDVQAVGWDLCQDPHRHDLPACAQFLEPQAAHNRSEETEDRMQRLKSHHEMNEATMAHLHLLEKHLDDLKGEEDQHAAAFKAESEKMLKELCADPARSSYPTCAQFKTTTLTSPGAPPSNLRGGHHDASVSTTLADAPRKNLRASMQIPALSWNSMKAWVTKHAAELSHIDHERKPLTFHRQDERLRGQWQGQAPLVACITVLPQGQVTEQLMKTFMDNYKAQEYEGDRKLVIIYHQDDQQAKDIAQPYVNGKSITAAAAFGEGKFISSTAYRYGGWLAKDADITAQWDFDAWHHPLQLSLQVRAMAVSDRPSSVITWVTDYSADGTKSNTVQGGIGLHGSMVGETSWMRKYWMPLIEDEQSVPSGLHAREVVQVDMPELLMYHDFAAHAHVPHP